MDQPVRKKSVSSDSELSDEWSVVEPLLDGEAICMTATQTVLPRPKKLYAITSPNRTTDSDTDSVDIIESDSEAGVLSIANATAYNDTLVNSQVKDDYGLCWCIKKCYHQYLDPHNSKSYLKNWFKLVGVFLVLCGLVVYSSMALISFQGKLFAIDLFDEPSVHISDGRIVSEIVKAQVQTSTSFDGGSIPPRENLEIDVEVISPGKAEVKLPKPANCQTLPPQPFVTEPDVKTAGTSKQSSTRKPLNVYEAQQEKLNDLKSLMNHLTTTTYKPRMLSLLKNVHGQLENIESLFAHINSNQQAFSEQAFPIKNVRKKLVKFVDGVGNEFEKVLEKVSKKVSNFHQDLLSKVCMSTTSHPEHLGCDIAITSAFSKEQASTSNMGLKDCETADSTVANSLLNHVPSETNLNMNDKKVTEIDNGDDQTARTKRSSNLMDDFIKTSHESYIADPHLKDVNYGNIPKAIFNAKHRSKRSINSFVPVLNGNIPNRVSNDRILKNDHEVPSNLEENRKKRSMKKDLKLDEDSKFLEDDVPIHVSDDEYSFEYRNEVRAPEKYFSESHKSKRSDSQYSKDVPNLEKLRKKSKESSKQIYAQDKRKYHEPTIELKRQHKSKLRCAKKSGCRHPIYKSIKSEVDRMKYLNENKSDMQASELLEDIPILGSDDYGFPPKEYKKEIKAPEKYFSKSRKIKRSDVEYLKDVKIDPNSAPSWKKSGTPKGSNQRFNSHYTQDKRRYHEPSIEMKRQHKSKLRCAKKSGCRHPVYNSIKSDLDRLKYANENASTSFSNIIENGFWYSDIGENRAKKRSVASKSEWLFDRYRARRALRNDANWSLNRASMRDLCRLKSQYPWCSNSKIL